MVTKSFFKTPGMEYIILIMIGMLLSLFPAIALFVALGVYGFFSSFCFLIFLTLIGCGFGVFRNLDFGEAGERDLEIARRITVWVCVIIAFFCLIALILAGAGYFDTFFDLLDGYSKSVRK
jgi:hypothetical protein